MIQGTRLLRKPLHVIQDSHHQDNNLEIITMGNAGSSATDTWSRTCSATGRAIGDGPDLLFLSSLSKEDRHEAKALIKEQNYLKAKTEWLDQMISNAGDKMTEYEYKSDEWNVLNEKCQKEYNEPKFQALARLKLLKNEIKKLRKKAMKNTGNTIASPIKATVSITGDVLKKTGDVVVAGTTGTVSAISSVAKNTEEQNDKPPESKVAEIESIKAETTESVSVPVDKEPEQKNAAATSRRSSLLAKEKQIDELAGEAESYKSNLEKLEEESISEEQIAERMKQLEAES